MSALANVTAVARASASANTAVAAHSDAVADAAVGDVPEHRVVELRDVRVRYGAVTALDISRLTVERGQTLTVMGPNGSGKTTLLRVMALLEKPAGGKVMHDGREVSTGADALSRRRHLALVMQQALFRNASTWENVATGLRFRRLPRSEIRRRVDWWLARLGIAGLARQNARSLSGGEAQRANLARALVLEPDLLLLDEPFSALDATAKLELMDDLAEILRRTRTTTVFVTHDRAEAQVLGDRLAVIISGTLRQTGSTNEIFSMPAGEDVANAVGVENVLTGTVKASSRGLAWVMVSGHEITVVGDFGAGEQVVVGLRPEVITLSPTPYDGVHTSARNSVVGDIVRITPMGAQARVVLDCGFPLVSLVTQGSITELGLEQGMRIRATFKASAAHTIRRIRAARACD